MQWLIKLVNINVAQIMAKVECFCIMLTNNHSLCYRNNKAYDHLGTKSLYFNHPIATSHYPLPLEIESIAEVIILI